MKHALACIALVVVSGCGSSPTHFDSSAGGGIGGGNGAATSTGTGSGSGSGSTSSTSSSSTTSTTTSTSTSSTGGTTGGNTPLGGSLQTNVQFTAQTVAYAASTVNGRSAVIITAYEPLLSCADLSDPAKRAGDFFQIGIISPTVGGPSAGLYDVSDGGVTMATGVLFTDGGVQIADSQTSGTMQLDTNVGAVPMSGSFQLNANGTAGSKTFGGTVTAYPCP